MQTTTKTTQVQHLFNFLFKIINLILLYEYHSFQNESTIDNKRESMFTVNACFIYLVRKCNNYVGYISNGRIFKLLVVSFFILLEKYTMNGILVINILLVPSQHIVTRTDWAVVRHVLKYACICNNIWKIKMFCFGTWHTEYRVIICKRGHTKQLPRIKALIQYGSGINSN